MYHGTRTESYDVPIWVGTLVLMQAGQDDVTDYGFQLGRQYAGIVIDINNATAEDYPESEYLVFTIKVFKNDGSDTVIQKSGYYCTHSDWAHMIDKNNKGTFSVINAQQLFEPRWGVIK